MRTLLLLFGLWLMAHVATAQTPEEAFQAKLTPIYMAADADEKAEAAQELYDWVLATPEQQTYTNWLILQQVFQSQAPNEALAEACGEKAQTALAEMIGSNAAATSSNASTGTTQATASYPNQEWYEEHMLALFSSPDAKAVRLAVRYLNDHPDLHSYNNYMYVGYGYERLGQYAEAKEYYERGLSLSEDPKKIFHSYVYYSNFLTRTGRFLEAQEYIDRIQTLSTEADPLYRTSYYSEWLNAQSIYYLFTGDYYRYAETAERMYAHYRKQTPPESLACDPYTTTPALVKAFAYEQLGDYDSARILWEQYDALQLAWTECTKREPLYPDQPYLAFLPLYEAKAGLRPATAKHNAAEITQAIAYYKTYEQYANMSARYRQAIHLAYLGAEDYPQRMQAVMKEMAETRDFTESTLPWAEYAFLRTRDGDWSDAWSTYKELFSMNEQRINDIIFSFGEQAFVAYYNVKLKLGYDNFHSFVRLLDQEQHNLEGKAIGQALNNVLFTKSLAFKGSQRRKQAFLQSQSPEVAALYQEWLLKKQALVQVYQRQSQSSTVDTTQAAFPADSLRRLQDAVARLENRLANEAEGFQEQLQLRAPSWQSIQRRLQPGEAAIELVRAPWRRQGLYSDSAFYVAYILRADAREPVAVYLTTPAQELETSYYAGYKNSIRYRITDTESYRRFWAPIAEQLSGIEKVYVANDGVYHMLNLPTLYNPDTDQFLGETLGVQYLTSTANLLETKTPRAVRRAILLGRPSYETGETPQGDGDGGQRNFVASFENMEVADLPGTEDEVTAVADLLQGQSVAVERYLGEEAREEVLYAVNNPSIVHIATHGYWNTLDYKATEGFRTFNAMVNSGLLLTGVVDFYRAPSRPNTHDGVLTAYEATTLNLHGTSMVVLSACETGLGLLDAGEGVYGLQRAFRAAGAESTLTSLWKVDDAATRDFMTAFYGHLVRGSSKFESWRLAQAEVREQYPEPYYWGAFVLVGE